MLPAAPPSCFPFFFLLTSRHRHLFAGLFGCNRFVLFVSCCLLIYIYIRVSLSRCPFVLLCRTAVSLRSLTHTYVGLSISFLHLSSALRFKTPVVPPRFSTQAYSNATAQCPILFRHGKPSVRVRRTRRLEDAHIDFLPQQLH